uniref:DEXDc domain containing protein n=1 Tax=uncultured Caudovirales phage TaxID=2100421 RepID=A0A6J5L2H9_9CAUD|nr:DEXDc domain containing protein [uncultured Caudovirales phage]
MAFADLFKAMRGEEVAGHKYLRREADGKGGWRYFYAVPGQPEREAPDPTTQKRQLGLFAPPEAAAPSQTAPEEGKPVKPQQMSLFADLPAAAKEQAERPHKAAAAKAKKPRESAATLFDGPAYIEEPPQAPVRVRDVEVAEPPAAAEPPPPAVVVSLSKTGRESANARALDLVKRGGKLTAEERAEVAKFTGTGGIGDSLNQYFTRPDIAASMWNTLARFGLQPGASVLEPACGAGVFLQTAPDSMHVTGVEIENDAAAIARALYGAKHTVEHSSFEEFTIAREGVPGTQFDAVITNAPFSTRTGDGIRIHKPEVSSADWYFVDTALDNVKDGGLISMIVMHGVMDGKSGMDARQRLSARAELLDAWRLPGEAFKHAHTNVVSDVIVMRKRPSDVAQTFLAPTGETAMRAAGAYDDAFVNGTWFDSHPERVLGTARTAEETGYRMEVTGDPEKIAPSIREAEPIDVGPAGAKVDMATLHALAAGDTPEAEDIIAAVLRSGKVTPTAPLVGATKVIAGQTYILMGNPPRWHRLDTVQDVAAVIGKSGDKVLEEAAQIAKKIGDLLDARKSGDVYKARFIRRDLVDRVNAWVTANGLPAEHEDLARIAKLDPSMLRLLGAVHDDGSLSDVLTADPPAVKPTDKVDRDSLVDVCNHSAVHSDGYVALSDVRAMWTGAEGLSDDDLKARIFATGQFAIELNDDIRSIEDYLTGDLYEKRDAEIDRETAAPADKKAQIKRQIDMLTETIAKRRKVLDDVLVTLESAWVPLHVMEDFLNNNDAAWNAAFGWRSNNGASVKLLFDKDSAFYRAEFTEDGRTYTDDGTQRTLLQALNRLKVGSGKEQDYARVDQLNEMFGEWVKGSKYRADLEELYNRTFFADAKKQFSAADMNLPGMSETIKVNPYINETVRWAMDAKNGIVALDVGLGKTFTGILLARALKAQGAVKKPVVIVPKSVATNWAEEIETITPGARVLVIGETRKQKRNGEWMASSDSAQERNRKLALMQQNDYDLVIVTKPAFERIPLKGDTIEKYESDDFWFKRAAAQEDTSRGSDTSGDTARRKLDELKEEYMDRAREAAGIALEKPDGKKKKGAKDIEKDHSRWQAEQAKLDYQHAKDFVFWEDLGVDCLLADEAHAYKNLNAARGGRGQEAPKFLGGSGLSKQAKHMKMMARVVRDENAGRNYFLTATPTKNSPLEVYNMLEHLVPGEWERRGIRNSEEFIGRYCKIEKKQVLNTKGNIEEAPVVVGFQHLDELTDLMDRYVRIRTAPDVGLPLPNAREHLELVDMNPMQKDVYRDLRQEALDAANNASKKPGEIFRALDRMKKAAMDLEIFDPDTYAGEHKNSPKYLRCVDNAVRAITTGKAAEAAAKENGTAYHGHGQIIFVDSNDSHERIKGMLIDRGIPASEIAIINADVAKDSETRQEIGRKFNKGEVSVVIGNTATMGEGVNLQRRTTAIHHLDEPWDPGTIQQRNGRGVRQGNPNANIDIYTYLAKASFDGFRHGTLEGKRGWLTKLRSGAKHIENEAAAEALQSQTDMMVMLSDDPEAERVKMTANVEQKKAEWKAKKAAEAVADYASVVKARARLAKMVEAEREAGRLNTSKVQEVIAQGKQRIEGLVLKLERNAELPEGVRKVLRDENSQALVDAASGKLFLPGTAVVPVKGEDWRGKGIIESVDLGKQTATVRKWATLPQSYGSPTAEVDIATLAKSYDPTGETHADEIRVTAQRGADDLEKLKGGVKASDEYTLKSGLKTPFHTYFGMVGPEHLQEHEGDIRQFSREAIRHVARTESTYDNTQAAVRDAGGALKLIPAKQVGEDTHVVLPIGQDAEDLAHGVMEEWRKEAHFPTTYEQGTGVMNSSYNPPKYAKPHTRMLQTLSGGSSSYSSASPSVRAIWDRARHLHKQATGAAS